MKSRTAAVAGMMTFFGWLAVTDVSPAAEERLIAIGNFSGGTTEGWNTESFDGHSSYNIVEHDGEQVLEAVSNDAASGLIIKVDIDLTETPMLTWRWKTEGPVPVADERAREGDDFALRVYFLAPGDGLFALPDAVTYVWAHREPEGADWINPFNDKVRVIAVDSGTDNAGKWRNHRRNMREDFRKLFGRDITEVLYIALMTDTDNSNGSARSWYGDIAITATE